MHTLAQSLPTADHAMLAKFGSRLTSSRPEMLAGDFAGCVVSALEEVKGTLLFQMHVEAAPESRRVAGVSLGSGASREFALVTLRDDAGSIRVESVNESNDPLAAIAPAYLEMIDVLDCAT